MFTVITWLFSQNLLPLVSSQKQTCCRFLAFCLSMTSSCILFPWRRGELRQLGLQQLPPSEPGRVWAHQPPWPHISQHQQFIQNSSCYRSAQPVYLDPFGSFLLGSAAKWFHPHNLVIQFVSVSFVRNFSLLGHPNSAGHR